MEDNIQSKTNIDEAQNIFDLIDIIATEIKPFKGWTGYDNCDSCNCDCIEKAVEMAKIISLKYRLVLK